MRLPRRPGLSRAPAAAGPAGGKPFPSLPVDRRRFLRLAGAATACGAAAATIPLASRADGKLAASGAGPAGLPAPGAPVLALRPPATPLAVRSMYLSAWLPADDLPGTWPTFWNGHITAITGLVRVDGTTYLWCGDPAESFPRATQVSLEVTATQSVYTLTAGPVTLTARFFSPVDPLSLQRQSVPLSYITVTAAAHDGGRHAVRVYLDISAEWAHGNLTEPVVWQQQRVQDLNVITVTPASPAVFAEFGEQASWGTVVWATDDVPGLSWQTGQDVVVRGNAAHGALPNTNDIRQPRAISDDWPVFAFLRDLGQVTATPSAEVVACLGHVRQPAVSYLGQSLQPYWTTFWPSWPDMLTWFRRDLTAARATCGATDTAVRWWAGQHPAMAAETAGQYAAITSLAVRQAFGGTELVTGPGGVPWAFLKEISSSGNVTTVDVLFPASAAYLQLSPDYLQMLLAPVLDYAGRHGAAGPWAPHDLGPRYPVASGAPGPGGTQMPIEESGDMLMMAAAVLARMPPADAAAYARAHYPILRQWAVYLLSQEPDYPGPQNQTDDFTGTIARSVNLNLKGIVAIAAFSQIAGYAGHGADQAAAAASARRSIGKWSSLGQDPAAARLDLGYGDTGSFSLDYNAYPDRLLNINLVTPVIQARQAATYLSEASAYGVPLDSRHTYTKADWEMLTAAFLYAQPAARDMLIGKLFAFLGATPSRVPFTDWYDAVAGTQTGFQGRPVVGGTLALDTLRCTPNGLTGYWPFSAGNALDASGNSGDLTLAGGARYATGGTAGALSLSGTRARASSARPVVRTDGSFTVTAWVKLARRGGWGTAVSQDGSQASGFALQYAAAQDRWAFAMTSADSATSPATRARSSRAPAVGRWVHLAGVRDAAAGQVRLYVGGVLEDAASVRETWNASGGLQIGRGLRDGAPDDFFPGAVREVRTYRRALSAAEVTSSATLAEGLLASFAADEGAGAQAGDQGGAHTLQLGQTTWGPGFSGAGLAFNGSSAAASTGGFINTSGDFSVSAWVLLNDIRGWHTAVSQDGATVSGFFLQYSLADNAWAFSMLAADSATAPATRALAPLPPRTGAWQHLTGVHDTRAGQLRLYVDGRPAGTAAFRSGWTATGAFVLGRGLSSQPTDWFDGRIDQVRVWSRALSDIDVSVLV